MSSFQQVLAWGMAHGNTLLFVLVWLTITALAAIWVTSAVGRAGNNFSEPERHEAFNQSYLYMATDRDDANLLRR
jgi:hypothetical protein